MEVIFIKDLKNQGKKGEIKTVKDGFAENYLIKNGYAVKKTKENLAKLKYELAKKEKLDEENKKNASKLKEELKSVILEFTVKTGEDDKVFGSISLKQIKDELKKKGFEIEKSQIEIPNAIQSLGFHNVIIHLYPEIDALIKVHVIK